MDEITFQVQRDEPSGMLVACWDNQDGFGGITTQGQDLSDLQQQITEAVGVHFEEGSAPRRIRIHFVPASPAPASPATAWPNLWRSAM